MKLLTEAPLRGYVATKFGGRWSPGQISQTLIKECHQSEEIRATAEAIYQALYFPGRSGLRRELGAKREEVVRRADHDSSTP